MSDFGTSGVASAIFIAGLVAVPFYGWSALLGLTLLAIGYTILIGGANQGYRPDGTRRKRPQVRRPEHGPDRRSR